MKVYLCELADKGLFRIVGAGMSDNEREQGIIPTISCYSSIKSAIESFEYLRNMYPGHSVVIDIYEIDAEDNEILQINQSDNIIGLPQYLVSNLLLYGTMLIPYDKYYSKKILAGVYSIDCLCTIKNSTDNEFMLFNCNRLDSNINSISYYNKHTIYNFSFIQ